MRLSSYLKPELVEISMEANDKWELIGKMTEILDRSGKIGDRATLLDKMVTRENTMTTGIGHGIAIPHAMSSGVETIVLAVATLKVPVEYESYDMKPVSVVFAIATPKDRDKKYMMLLSHIAKMFQDRELPARLCAAKSSEQLMEIIAGFDT